MEFTLALELHMPVAELRHRLSSREFAEWGAFLTWRHQVREKAERAASGGGSRMRRGGMGR